MIEQFLHLLRVGNRRGDRGLSLAEIICAIGFLGVFTTGLLAIATKGFKASEQDIDMAAAYQHGETIMERYALITRDPSGWADMSAVDAPAFPTELKPDGTEVPDYRFVYTATLDDIDSDVRMLIVTVFRADQSSVAADPPVPAVDTASPRQGELLRFTNILQQEVNDA